MFATHSPSQQSPIKGERKSTPVTGANPDLPPDTIPEVALTENPFDSESSRILFDAIDQLQSCDAGRDIDIPQLVIVGGQSTGKSSLLQSLVDIPFPTGQGCCTRFATRIVSRRTAPGSRNECVITIVKPDFDLNEYFDYEPNTSYESFRHHGETLSSEEFEVIMKDVEEEFMGIKPGKGKGAKNFATEVLKVELSGPKRSHFSILDIPGVFENPQDVNVAEMEGVKKMVIEYLRKPQNLVICIADAGNDLANQGVFTLAEQHVKPKNLVRVFTKCDNVRDPSDVIRIATTGRQFAKSNSKQNDWFVVRNRRHGEGPDFDLAAAEEELFGQHPWTEIDKSRRGSTMLRVFLGNVLCSRIRAEFPDLQQKVNALLRDAETSRKALGDPRPSHQLRVQYLVDIVQKFQLAAKQALDSPGRLPAKDMRVRGFVATKNLHFDSAIRDHGHWYNFEEVPDISVVSDETVQSRDNNVVQSFGSSFGVLPHTPDASPKSKHRSTNSHKLFTKSSKNTSNEISEIRKEIKAQIENFQSNTLPGLLNTDVFPVIYRTQTQKWLEMATAHLQDIANDTLGAAMSIMGHVNQQCNMCPTALDGMTNTVFEFHKLTHERAEKALIDYMDKEQNFPLQTTNPVFGRMVEEMRLQRYKNAAFGKDLGLKQLIQTGIPDTDLIMDHLGTLLQDILCDSATRMENDIHDVLKVYYDLSLQSFIDFTTKRVIEDFVSSKNGPLFGLSTDYILNLSEAEVESLAREDDVTLSEREKYDEIIARLQHLGSIVEDALKRTAPLQGQVLSV